jgi:hypothetical protein
MTSQLSRRGFVLSAAAMASPYLLRADEEKLSDGSAAKDMVTPESQKAIDHALDYLSRTQHDDGSWGERTQFAGNVAVTSLAALAFMAGGHQPDRGKYGRNVLRALEYVLSREARDGEKTPGFLWHPSSNTFGAMYSHGFAALFLGEAYGMIPKRELQKQTRDVLERAVALIIKSQNSEGGWRYEPKPKQADVSVTICQIMALRSARNAGLTVSKNAVEQCVKYVKACQNDDGGFNYFRNQRNSSAFARSAAGVVALYCAGIYEGREISDGLRYLMQFKPGLNSAGPAFGRGMDNLHYFYGHYYAAQAMWTAGGKYWSEWFPAIREDLLARSRHNQAGVWTEQTTCTDYATAMAAIILQIPNNYLPIMQK